MGVRHEKVVLTLEDRYTTTMAKAAAATAVLNRNLESLDGTSVDTSRSTDDLGKSTKRTGDETEKASKKTKSYTLEMALADERATRLRKSLRLQAAELVDVEEQAKRTGEAFRKGGADIDRYSGRLRLLGEATAVIAPALVPLGAAAVPAVAALTAGLGAAAGAAGVALLAFNGLGDAMDALDEFQIDPTTENLAALRDEFDKIGPSAAHFVQYLDSIEPELSALQMTARDGALPGFEQGIDALLQKAPQVQAIIRNISRELGALAAGGGEALAGERFDAFFDYLETDAAPILGAFARSIGNVAEGLGQLLVAFSPLTNSFTVGLERVTASFAAWSAELSRTDGFREFVEYVRTSGPQVGEFLGALTDAFVGIVTAAAPFGQTVLPALTGLAQVLGAIASSPIGPELFTAAAGFIALNRATILLGPGMRNLSEAFTDLRTSPNLAATAVERFGRAGRIAAGAAGMGLLLSSLHQTNDGLRTLEGVAGGALAGLSTGSPWGVAIGGAIGLVTSFGEANRTSAEYVAALTASLDEQTGALTESSEAAAAKYLEDQGLLKIAESLGLNLHTVTDAALGNRDALAEVNTELQAYRDSLGEVSAYDTAGAQAFQNKLDATDKLSSSLENLADDTDSTVAAQKRVAAASRESGVAFEQSGLRMKAARSSARETGKSFISLGDDLNNAKVSLDGWLKELEEQAHALEQFGLNARKAAKNGLDNGLIKSLKEAGPAGALRMKQLANATDAEIDRANRAWRRGRAAIKEYVDLDVPTKRVDVDTSSAMAKLAALRSAIGNMPDGTRGRGLGVLAPNGYADGGTVDAYAAGGTIRSAGPRTFPAALATDENGAAA